MFTQEQEWNTYNLIKDESNKLIIYKATRLQKGEKTSNNGLETKQRNCQEKRNHRRLKLEALLLHVALQS